MLCFFGVYQLAPGVYEFSVSPMDSYGTGAVAAKTPDQVLSTKSEWGTSFISLLKADATKTPPQLHLQVYESVNQQEALTMKSLYDKVFNLNAGKFSPQ